MASPLMDLVTLKTKRKFPKYKTSQLSSLSQVHAVRCKLSIVVLVNGHIKTQQTRSVLLFLMHGGGHWARTSHAAGHCRKATVQCQPLPLERTAPRGPPSSPSRDEEMRREQSCALFGMPLLLPLLLLMMIMVMLGDGRGAARG